jgi:chemotaxis protein MotB
MAGQTNAAPVIIKRKKIIAAGGHHGGAWKVAYADFVTAMMAFFMLMWLLNATTEKQRKGIADYFNPTIPINRISGGGDGAFFGDSVLSEQTMAQNGTGATASIPTDDQQARGEVGQEQSAGATGQDQNQMQQVEKALAARSGESMTMKRLLRHVVTRVTDEGLVIELFDLPDAPLFESDSAVPTGATTEIAAILAEVFSLATNEIAIAGHVRAYPVTLAVSPVWELSAARAQAIRGLVETAGLDRERMNRVTGYADREPVTADPAALRNNRIEVVLLRLDR